MKIKLLALFLLSLVACKKEDTAAPQTKQQVSTNTIKLVISSPTTSNVVGAYYNPNQNYFTKEISYNLNSGDSLIAWAVGEIKTTTTFPYQWYSDYVQIEYYKNGVLIETITGNGQWVNVQSDFKLWLRRKI